MQAGLVVRLLCAYCRLSKFVLSIYYEKQRLPLAKSLGLRHMTYSKSTSLFELPQKLRPQDADRFEKRRPFLKNCVLSPKNGVSANAEYVTINGTNSDYMNVLCGVPQGSILGPILFILYINDMCNVSTLLKPILFADDTNLFYSGKDIDELCSVVSIELDKLCIWFQVNKLSLNTSKTNFMIFTNRSCDDTYSVCMNGLNLSRVFVTKFLGVHMDSKLDWNYHIGIVRNKVAKNVSVMNRVKHVLTRVPG